MLIDVISPSGSHTDLKKFEKGCQVLRDQGHTLMVRAPAEGWQRFGGDDMARLDMIHAAASGPADVVMCSRGGYGLSRLLDRIDWPLIARGISRGQRWIGFSDFTAFQSALFSRTGAMSFAGPMVTEDFGADQLNETMLVSFQALLRGVTPVVQWDSPAPGQREALKLARASVSGRLTGGNLCMLASLVGSPYFPGQASSEMLWIEDVAEHPYRVERMLHQLLYAGVLHRHKAIIFGGFTAWKPAAHDAGYGWDEMLGYFREKLAAVMGDQAPLLIEGLPFGHQAAKTILAFGRAYRLSCLRDTLSLEPL